jgi:cytochrome c oxidase subunit III
MNSGIGTAEPIVEDKKQKKRPTLTTGEGTKSGGKNRGGGGGGGNNGGNNGGGGNNPNNQNFDQAENQFKPDKLRIVMWFLLLVVVMTFSALIGTYIVLSTNGVAEWQPFNLPVQVWVSTVLILVSSFTYHISNRNLQNDNQESAKKWLLATVVLGGTFISSQILVWSALAYRGVYLRGNPFAGLFYILTFVHAVHVLGGILALGYMVLRSWYETHSEFEMLRRKTTSKVVGWYWHFMGGLWIVLFLLLGFWK